MSLLSQSHLGGGDSTTRITPPSWEGPYHRRMKDFKSLGGPRHVAAASSCIAHITLHIPTCSIFLAVPSERERERGLPARTTFSGILCGEVETGLGV